MFNVKRFLTRLILPVVATGIGLIGGAMAPTMQIHVTDSASKIESFNKEVSISFKEAVQPAEAARKKKISYYKDCGRKWCSLFTQQGKFVRHLYRVDGKKPRKLNRRGRRSSSVTGPQRQRPSYRVDKRYQIPQYKKTPQRGVSRSRTSTTSKKPQYSLHPTVRVKGWSGSRQASQANTESSDEGSGNRYAAYHNSINSLEQKLNRRPVHFTGEVLVNTSTGEVQGRVGVRTTTGRRHRR